MMAPRKNIPLSRHTTFRVGGPADYFVQVAAPSELAQALEFAEEHGIPAFIMGGGSNVVFSDKGFRGLVIKMANGGAHITGNRVLCGAGVALYDVLKVLSEAGLSGMERLAGIPGSVGGAVRGNAGAFGTDIGSFVRTVRCFNKNTGMVREMKKEECDFGYRMSIFKQQPELVITSVELELAYGDKNELSQIMTETVAKRESKHPQDAWCAGSFFTNPVVTDEALRREFERDNGVKCKDDKLPAGWLIDQVGLRGKRVGGAMVSDLHPNYIVNTGTATAEDIITLASFIKTRVRDELRVQLKEEVQLVGF